MTGRTRCWRWRHGCRQPATQWTRIGDFVYAHCTDPDHVPIRKGEPR